jgi:hemoglobin/transferrin/lactoferrin receptor protein
MHPNPPRLPARLRRCAVGTVLSTALLAAFVPQARAQNAPAAAPVAISIPAMPLGQALNELARQAGIQMSFPAALVAGKTAPSVSGQLTAKQAVDRLLAGSGLVAQFDGSAVLVKPQPAPTAAQELQSPPVNIQAARGPRDFSVNAVQIDRTEIERIEPRDLQDLFQGEPNIQVGSSIPMSQKLYVNGVEETALAVTIDGSRQNNKIFHHNATTLIDPILLKAVSVNPGVAPADAGPGALAGAIAYQTVSAREMLAPGKNLGGLFKTEYETNGSIFANSGSVYGTADNVDYLGYIKYASGDWRDDGDGNPIIGSGTSLVSGLGKLAYQALSGDRLELTYELVKDDDARPYRANIGQIIGGRPVPLTRNYDLQRQNMVLSYTDATPQGWWDPTIKLAYSLTELGLSEPENFNDGKTSSWNGKLENRFKLALGSVTAGVDFYDDVADYKYRYTPDPLFNEAAEEKASNIGVYGQARLDLTKEARLSFGGRADFQRFTGVDKTRINESGLSFNLSGEYDVSRYLTLGAGYADVWGGIPLAENFIMNPAWTYADGIEPVTSKSWFGGLRSNLAGIVDGLSLEARGFRTVIDNARTPSYGGGPALQTNMSSTGFDLAARYDWSEGFARIAYADIDTRIDGRPADSDIGRYLTTPIGRVMSLQAAQSFLNRQLFIGGNAEIVFDYTDTFDADTGSRGAALPGSQVWNAYVEYRPRQVDYLTLRLDVFNIFDETYVSRATYGQEYPTVVPLYEPGRSVRLMLMLRF